MWRAVVLVGVEIVSGERCSDGVESALAALSEVWCEVC